MFGIFPEFGGLLQDAGRFYRNFRSKSKKPVCNHFGPHGSSIEQPIMRNSVGSGNVPLCRAYSLHDHLDH